MKRKLINAVTRKVRSKNLNRSKLKALAEIAKRLGDVCQYVWRKYGGVRSLKFSAFDVRNQMMVADVAIK